MSAPPSSRPTLLVMRHPRTAAAPGLCYGRHDPGLAPGWEARIDALAPGLRAPSGPACIVTSPAPRCLKPARRLAAALSLPLAEDPRLRELDFGAWEGRPWSEIPRDESDPWAEDPRRRAPPGGETFEALADRTARALAEAPPGALLLCHAGPIRAILMALRGLSFDQAFARPVPYATPFDPAPPG
ncbi:histidine phosphatase family protein [Albimonas sp. CAU 1670]|uniref:histidine phosphatase family protein n=1 Tax=Albimonas sp. CAU 1670 TaxID=3032599 RepID=UPI0023DA83B0|nr:histidine phosphatase family protein [Albimonas sp. CAU 1670]MDF2233888.1 histidine phosphatase family protein [Albimonas sp. CAU 1670]